MAPASHDIFPPEVATRIKTYVYRLIESLELRKLLSQNVMKLRGQDLKRYEDTLDALFCAYLAWHCWRWGEKRNEMVGDMEHGYVVVPRAGSSQG